MSSAGNNRANGTCNGMVTQMYTFNTSWQKQKNGYNSHGLPYVGFPGLTLTPIPESPLLDSMLNEDAVDHSAAERHRWLSGGSADCTPCPDPCKDSWDPSIMQSGSLPKHWLSGDGRGRPEEASLVAAENGELGGLRNGLHHLSSSSSSEKTSPTSSAASPVKTSKTCAVNVRVVHTTTFLPKEEQMTTEQKRSHTCKLLLFALCGFLMVAGIVLWIFSPAFT